MRRYLAHMGITFHPPGQHLARTDMTLPQHDVMVLALLVQTQQALEAKFGIRGIGDGQVSTATSVMSRSSMTSLAL